MTPCCENTVTPIMIKRGEIKIGDKIIFEDDIKEENVPVSANIKTDESTPAAAPVHAEHNVSAAPTSANVPNAEHEETVSAAAPAVNTTDYLKPYRMAPKRQNINMPLTYKEMTPYMELTEIEDINNSPMIAVPHSPLDTENYTEAINPTDIQAYTGFLRTQMGRYLRIEQLIGSTIIKDRYGFLVGIGTNFIILQEITSGNIMVIDLYTIKMTYIYYSEPVFPQGTI